MRFALTAQVESRTRLRHLDVLEVPDGGLRVEFFPDRDGVLNRIRVSTPTSVENLPEVHSGEEEIALNINLNYDIQQYRELEDFLKYIESLFFFPFRTQRVHWDSPTIEWVPEDEDEEKLLQMYSIQHTLRYPETDQEFDIALASRIIGSRETHGYLAGPFAFLRSGYNEHSNFRYGLAYQLFFMFIEGLYGGGKHGTKALIAEFKSSRHVSEAVKRAYRQLQEPDAEAHFTSIKGFLGEQGCDDSLEGLIRFLITMRGRVLHYWHRSSRRTVTPLTERELEGVSFFAWAVCIDLAKKLFLGESPE